MAWIAPAIAAAGQVVGGAIASHGTGRQAKANERASVLSYNLQRKFAQNQIKWRVEDAQRAGLHPLFALGGAGSTFSPSPTAVDFGPKYSELGQGVARAAQALATMQERKLYEAQLRAVEAGAEKDLAISQYYKSEAARNAQNANISKPVGLQTFPLASAPPSMAGMLVQDLDHYHDSMIVKPQEVPSRSSEFGFQTPHSVPGMQEYSTPAGELLLPYSEEGMGEALENVSGNPLLWSSVYNANVARYGQEETLRKMRDLFVPKGMNEAIGALGDGSARAAMRAREFYDWVRENVFHAPPQYRR